MKYCLLFTNRCARKGACEQAVIYLCLLKKLWNVQKYKQQPQCTVITSDLSSNSPDSTKTLKVLIALLFLTYAKKVLYYSLTPWRKCVTESVNFFMYTSFSQIKKKKRKLWKIFVYCPENRNTLASNKNTLPVFLLIVHVHNIVS